LDIRYLEATVDDDDEVINAPATEEALKYEAAAGMLHSIFFSDYIYMLPKTSE
jgi:hypothetical protein